MKLRTPDSVPCVHYRLPGGTSEADDRTAIIVRWDEDTMTATLNVNVLPGDIEGFAGPVYQVENVAYAASAGEAGKYWPY